jgi:ketosteroid isomerase-like protein
MSEDASEIVRRMNSAFNNGDRQGWLELIHVDAVYHEGSGYLDTPPVLEGREQILKAAESFAADLDGFRGDIVELVDAGDRVLCVTRWHGTGKSSGLPVETTEPIVYTVRDGVIVEGRVFPDRDAALAELGLGG